MEPFQHENYKKALKTEMDACIADMKEYQKEIKVARKQGNEKLVANLATQLEAANEQHNVAKTEYINYYGTGGL